ncbi:hypothetical protein [Enhydrobacter sp.]|jgi:hypothetical protein|uniref:hypothetical protein n=1 Tax=Enhydrobacter sp. TaxID=1894999 RepID=UPI0026331EC6|nr:hypothetical protein [Enhydrobacter sp.]WIM09864.1 MAG: hypothetical protein OJF58_000817 [Enhydrobacter sp.]
MRELNVAALAFSLAFGLADAASAQGVAPGGPIGNSTGIGSGLGAPIGGTAPSWPNGTTQPTLPPPPPPGGGTAPFGRPPAITTTRPPSYPKPLEPFGSPTSSASPLLELPAEPTADLSFLKGCWRTDVFRYAHQSGVATYCFDDRGVGRFLYRRLDQPAFYCRASARAGYADRLLRLQISATACSDGSSYPDSLDCSRGGGGVTKCDGRAMTAAGSEAWTVHLHRVR